MIGKMQTSMTVAAMAAMLAGASVAAAAENDRPDPMQIARGAKAWADTCGACHNLRDPKEFSDKNWDVIVNHMRIVVPLPGAKARDIKAFLKSSN